MFMRDDEEEEDVGDGTADNTCIVFRYKEEHELPAKYGFGQIYHFKGVHRIQLVLLLFYSILRCTSKGFISFY